MAASQARAAARHLHLVRAAQSAGEAFACPSPDEADRSRAAGRGAGLAWISLGLVALAALVFAF